MRHQTLQVVTQPLQTQGCQKNMVDLLHQTLRNVVGNSEKLINIYLPRMTFFWLFMLMMQLSFLLIKPRLLQNQPPSKGLFVN